MPYIANNLISAELQCLSVNDDGTLVSGLSTTPGVDFSTRLRRQTGTTWADASETVTITEATAGFYQFKFIPLQSSAQYDLYVKELDPLTMGRNQVWSYNVLPAGAVFEPSAVECFCAVSDVNRYSGLQLGVATTVTDTQGLAFVEERSAWLKAMCSYWGFPVSPQTLDPASTLADLLRAASAIGAAINVVIAWYSAVEPVETDKARQLLAQWIALVGDGDKLIGSIQALIMTELSTGGIQTHISDGEVSLADEGHITDSGLSAGMRMGRVF